MRKYTGAIVCGAFTLACCAAASAGDVQADLTADGYITENEDGISIDDNGPFLNMQDISSLDIFTYHTTLLEFSADGLNAEDILSAQLTVVYNGGGTNGTELHGYTSTADGAITADDLTGGSMIQNFDSSSLPGLPGDATSFDVTSFLTNALDDQSSEFGFRFDAVGDSTQLQWRSSEFDDGSYAPTLSVTLVPAPGALALLGLAGCIGTRRRR